MHKRPTSVSSRKKESLIIRPDSRVTYDIVPNYSYVHKGYIFLYVEALLFYDVSCKCYVVSVIYV